MSREGEATSAVPREPNTGIQVISRAASILRTLKEHKSGMSLGQIAEKIDLPRSTVQRIVSALEVERLLISSSRGGGIRLGPELRSLGIATSFNVVERCRPHLESLNLRTGETVDLSVLRGRKMIFLDQIQSTERLRAISSIGEEFPVTSTACGRACLAKLSFKAAEKLADEEWQEFGAENNWPELKTQLLAIGKNHIAYDLDDHTSGVSALGFAFEDALQELYAVSVPIPSLRYADKCNEVKEALLEVRTAVLEDLVS